MKKISYLLLLILFVSITITYAYFSTTLNVENGSKDIVTQTGTLRISYKDGIEINETNILPNKTITKTIVIENTGSLSTYYGLYWSELSNSIVYDELVMSMTCTNYIDGVVSGTCSNYNETNIPNHNTGIMSDIPINENEKHVYLITIKFLEMDYNQNYNQGKSFKAKILVEENNPWYINCSDNSNKLNCKILSLNEEFPDNIRSTYVDNDNGITYYENSSSTNGRGLYYSTDPTVTEDGKRIYFFRGQVDNNHVIFAGFCFRIVRTNEDGSIKLRYNGTPNNGECPTNGTAASIGSAKYNYSYNDASYVGYMYPNDSKYHENTESDVIRKKYIANNENFYYSTNYTYSSSTKKYSLSGTIISGYWNTNDICSETTCPVKDYYTCKSNDSNSDCTTLLRIKSFNDPWNANVTTVTRATISYEDATSNDYNSSVKNMLETWYANNIANKPSSVTSLVADSVYCNDRSINKNKTVAIYDVARTGYGTGQTFYGKLGVYDSVKPYMKCTNINDSFTVSSENGNGKLNYPVGLLTINEIYQAGASINDNYDYYLRTNEWAWSLSPISFNGFDMFAGVFFTDSNGKVNQTNYVDYDLGCIPVISLKGNVTSTTGNGTRTEPFIID